MWWVRGLLVRALLVQQPKKGSESSFWVFGAGATGRQLA